jgi:hypothetical protein
MPSSWSPSLRFELQFTGENINLWGEKLNAVLAHADYAVAGWLVKPLAAQLVPHVLTTANAGDDEARAAAIKFTGTGGQTVQIPSVSKTYVVWNACDGLVTLTTGAGSTVGLDADDVALVVCDGANVKQLGYGGLGLKAYISSVAAGGPGGNVPSPVGHSGKWLTNNGTIPFWSRPAAADLTDYDTAILGRQIALAVAL